MKKGTKTKIKICQFSIGGKTEILDLKQWGILKYGTFSFIILLQCNNSQQRKLKLNRDYHE